MLRVADVMIKEVEVIAPEASVEEAVLKMSDLRIGSLIVMNENQIVGILTARDIIKNIKPILKEADKLQVKELMNTNPIAISPEKQLEDAARVMAERDIKKLPVIDGGKLIGIITDTDILKSGEKLEEAVAKNIINILGYNNKGKLKPAY